MIDLNMWFQVAVAFIVVYLIFAIVGKAIIDWLFK